MRSEPTDAMNMPNCKASGFSLIEVMIVVLIIGILTAVAVPRYLDHVAKASDRSHKIKLMLLRDAIERYVVENDRALPPASERAFKDAMTPYLSDSFPTVDLNQDNMLDNFQPSGVAMVDSQALMVGENTPTKGWKYNFHTGQIIINLSTPTAVDSGTNYDDW